MDVEYKIMQSHRGIIISHHTSFHLWRLSVKHIHWFDTVLYHSYGPVEESHKMTETYQYAR